MLKIDDDYLADRLRSSLVKSGEYQVIKAGEYRFWTGWWSEPGILNELHEAMFYLWKDLIDVEKYHGGGFEYWLNKIDGPASSPWHQDVIESGSRMHGDKTVVYYTYVHGLRGGYLELSDYDKAGTGKEAMEAMECLNYEHCERIKPITNRRVITSSTRLHRVAPVHSGRREALLSTVYPTIPDYYRNNLVYTM